jgi:2-oxo-4-hydroxy-4-carboxy-5-ureidoimidazoline decarboxylase
VTDGTYLHNLRRRVTPTSVAGPDQPTGQPTGQPPEGIGLAAFNALPAERARDLLLGCCHADRWAANVTAGRPYPALGALLARAGEELTDGDVTEALAGHPRIGQAPAAGQNAWSRREQSGVGDADEAVLAELAAGNRAYEDRFGHIYLVCASGRSAGELLSILKDRLRNGPDAERHVVRDELRRINDLRLTKLVGPAQ